MKKFIKEGDKFNRLTAIKFAYKKGIHTYWLFKCDCGNEKVICVNNVKRGNTKSCGCLFKKSNLIHGMEKTKIYRAWASMKQRCLNSNNAKYKNYGGRGISICDEWASFENFYNDMGERPKGLTLDRIDNNKGYYKSNCRWTTPEIQNNNKRNNVFLSYNGKTKTMTQWIKELKKYKIK